MRHEGTGGSDRWCPRAFPPVRGRAARVGGSGTLVERIRASRRGGAVSRLTLGAAGAASPELAWERYVQVAYWSRWSPQIRSVTCSSPRIRTGSTGRVHAMLGVGVDFVVGSVDETARTWVWTVSKGPLTLDLTHRVVPEGDGCRTTLEMAGPLPALLAYAPLARLALGRLVRPQL